MFPSNYSVDEHGHRSANHITNIEEGLILYCVMKKSLYHQISTSKIQSYGDFLSIKLFVLLPRMLILWINVKWYKVNSSNQRILFQILFSPQKNCSLYILRLVSAWEFFLIHNFRARKDRNSWWRRIVTNILSFKCCPWSLEAFYCFLVCLYCVSWVLTILLTASLEISQDEPNLSLFTVESHSFHFQI